MNVASRYERCEANPLNTLNGALPQGKCKLFITTQGESSGEMDMDFLFYAFNAPTPLTRTWIPASPCDLKLLILLRQSNPSYMALERESLAVLAEWRDLLGFPNREPVTDTDRHRASLS